MTFPELDALRGQLGLSKAKLCQSCDFNPGTYTRWLRWARGQANGCKPNSRSLRALREALRAECASRARRAAINSAGHLPA